MANSNRVTIIIDADGRVYIQGMEKVTGSTKELESQTASVTERLRNHWLETAAAVYAVQRAIRTAWNMAEISAQYEEQRASLQAMTGQADALIERIQTASNGMISLSAAAATAGVGIMKGLSAGQLVELAEAAETLSNISGEKVPAAFRQMTEAIALGRERALESSIGIIDLNARYGEQVLRMSEAEKQAVRYAIVMDKVREVQDALGPSVTSTSDRMEQFTTSLSDLQLTIGAFVIKGAAALLATFQQIAAGAMYAVQGTLKLWELYNRFVAWLEGKEGGGDVFAQAAERARLNAEAAGQAAQALMDKARDSWALIQSKGEAVEKTFKRIKENIALPDPAKDAGGLRTSNEYMLKLNQEESEFFADRDRMLDDKRRAKDQAAATAALNEYDREQERLEKQRAVMEEEHALQNTRVQAAIMGSNIVMAAQQSMSDQMLALVETGKFSTEVFGKVIISQIKMTLAGIAAEATIRALYSTALGFYYAAIPGMQGFSTAAFIAAAKMAATAGISLASMAGVQAMFGGQTTRAEAGSIGGEPVRTTSVSPNVPAAYPAAQQAAPSRNITVIVQNGMGDETYWKNLWEKNILPAANDAAERNINLVVRTA